MFSNQSRGDHSVLKSEPLYEAGCDTGCSYVFLICAAVPGGTSIYAVHGGMQLFRVPFAREIPEGLY